MKLAESEGTSGKFMAETIEEWHRTGQLIELEKKWDIPATAYLKQMHAKYEEGLVSYRITRAHMPRGERGIQ